MVASQHIVSQIRESRDSQFERIVGSSAALETLLEQVERVGPTDSTVLIEGETGTGKELIAQAVHNVSPRCSRRFVKVNCAAIPHDLLESELFGHERGAFTGAIAQRVGRFEMAHQGTLFLDEIGDIPLALQPKLLRVLQEQEFERLGSGQTHKVDVRVIAATHRNLTEMAARNEFRSDLYYRLNVFPIQVPPLRERREDIPALVTHFVKFFGGRMEKQIEQIPPETMAALTSYSWPGNIRELQNLVQRAVILSDHGVLPNPLPTAMIRGLTAWEQPRNIRELENFIEPAVIVTGSKSLESPLGELGKSNTVADEYERRQRDEIVRALAVCKGRVGGADGAAARLGMNRTTLIFRMKKYGIYAKQYAYPQRASSSSPHP